MTKLEYVEEIAPSTGEFYQSRLPVLRFGLHTADAKKFGADTVLICFDREDGAGVEQIEVHLSELADIVQKLDRQHAAIAPPGRR